MAAAFAARYARALLEVLEAGNVDLASAERELGDFTATWQESPELRNVFLDPSIAAERKIAVLDRLQEKLGFSKMIRNFLAVVTNHGRMDGFEGIAEEFDVLVRGDLRIAKAEWTTARPLGEGDRRALEAKLAELTGERVEATFREDPALLGGARLRIGSMVYDGSVRGRLEGLREKLATS